MSRITRIGHLQQTRAAGTVNKKRENGLNIKFTDSRNPLMNKLCKLAQNIQMKTPKSKLVRLPFQSKSNNVASRQDKYAKIRQLQGEVESIHKLNSQFKARRTAASAKSCINLGVVNKTRGKSVSESIKGELARGLKERGYEGQQAFIKAAQRDIMQLPDSTLAQDQKQRLNSRLDNIRVSKAIAKGQKMADVSGKRSDAMIAKALRQLLMDTPEENRSTIMGKMDDQLSCVNLAYKKETLLKAISSVLKQPESQPPRAR